MILCISNDYFATISTLPSSVFSKSILKCMYFTDKCMTNADIEPPVVYRTLRKLNPNKSRDVFLLLSHLVKLAVYPLPT